MKRTSDSAVEPRRKVLTALAVSAVTLAGTPKLLEATESPKKKTPTLLEQYAFTLLIGRLCVDDKFRDQFFDLKDADAAMALIKKDNMPISPVVPRWVNAIFKAPKSLAGLKEACKRTEDAAQVKGQKLPPPCDPWPCWG